MVRNYVIIFDESYQRVTSEYNRSSKFIDRFYDIFLAKSEEIASKFKGVNLEEQKVMLGQSISHMISFSIDYKSDPLFFKIAKRHSKEELDVPSKYYDIWLECLIMAVQEFDPEMDPDIELAWRAIMAPGIEYMKFHY